MLLLFTEDTAGPSQRSAGGDVIRGHGSDVILVPGKRRGPDVAVTDVRRL